MVNISWADVGGKMIDAPSQPVCLPIFVGFQDRRFSVRLILHSILFRRECKRIGPYGCRELAPATAYRQSRQTRSRARRERAKGPRTRLGVRVSAQMNAV